VCCVVMPVSHPHLEVGRSGLQEVCEVVGRKARPSLQMERWMASAMGTHTEQLEKL